MAHATDEGTVIMPTIVTGDEIRVFTWFENFVFTLQMQKQTVK